MPPVAKPKRPDARSPFVFEVREFGRRPGAMRQFDRDLPAEQLLAREGGSLEDLYSAEGADLLLDLRLESVVEGVLATGRVSGSLVAECVRCLDPVEVEVDADFQELFYYDLEDLTAEELEEAVSVVEELVDVEALVRDALMLDLPLQPLCEPDCPGLCAECGASLAEDPEHHHDSVDPRWAALGALTGESTSAED
ncbi:MAG TPA: DUF177 domain-containing protein [Actinospica sp.]|jgi:uncharacterized protein|nr:DUF177 domain-containing protein [Actinospica sp.]